MRFHRNKLSYVGLMLCMGLALSAFMCNEADLHKANRAAKQISDDLHEGEAQVEIQFAAGNLNAAEATDLANAFSDATLVRGTFVTRLKTIKAIDSSNAAQVNQWFQDLVNDIGKIGEKVGHLKNPTAKAKFQLYVQSISAAMTIVQTLLVHPAPAPVSQSEGNLPVQRAGLDAAGMAVILAAFNGLAKLILQWRADGSLTDEQLQAAGDAQDADTRNHAALFIKSLESGSRN